MTENGYANVQAPDIPLSNPPVSASGFVQSAPGSDVYYIESAFAGTYSGFLPEMSPFAEQAVQETDPAMHLAASDQPLVWQPSQQEVRPETTVAAVGWSKPKRVRGKDLQKRNPVSMSTIPNVDVKDELLVWMWTYIHREKACVPSSKIPRNRFKNPWSLLKLLRTADLVMYMKDYGGRKGTYNLTVAGHREAGRLISVHGNPFA